MNLLHANDRPGEYPPSWYAETAVPHAPLPVLRGEARADVCVVGAGYTGLSAALHLAQRGYRVVVLEAQRVGFGASGRNGGQVGSGQRIGQDRVSALAGPGRARALWDVAEEARLLVRDLAEGMPGVDFTPGVLHACRSDAEMRAGHDEAAMLARDYGYGLIEPLDRAAVRAVIGSARFVGGTLDMGGGHLHPLNFALGLSARAQAAGAVIHERSEVIGIDHGPKVRLRTAEGMVVADHVIFGANGYLSGLAPEVEARVMPINNFIIATEPLGDRAADVLARPVAAEDSRFVINYWRLSGDGRLLFGGGESYGWRFPADIAAKVRKPMLEIYPQLADARITHAWGGTLAITMTRMPCFRRVAPNVLSASGYSGHGVTHATFAGKVMAAAVAGQAERFDLLAGLPQPRFPGGARLRHPLLVLAMVWYSLRDRLGV
ncbi:NAD(P)/FAD-dependent oxidoreductase [Ruixingdingia sedimenti]|uniref:FAD-binding oxidoreductase n=1 Tax=Ruixingdingia sedimenti TaxID=3073604 RepID=A0ABU1F5M5_9RHOB|nr:FAD-binding oxidoreductase [Xinfangfangia sp. LG-4]MDR5652185.1 FAD-binding oxidoreductase [Xinfangfangia sp. LG-4]